MRMWRPDWRFCRAVIAVTALYALALQAVLGGMTSVRTFDPAHALCLQDTGVGVDGPAKAPPLHDHLSCCTAAQAVPAVDVPLPTIVAIGWPVRSAVRAAWRPEIVASPRAPPGIGAGARAPPVV